jgi:RimJ/RimL family protein N-acetyltransferase
MTDRERSPRAGERATTDLATQRLRLERWAPRHGAMLARLASLPLVMRHVGTGAAWTAEQAAEHHERALAHWRDHDFGWRGAVERETGAAIGLIALNRAEGAAGLADDDFEIGWWLDPAVWGRGFATEGARAIIDEAFRRLGAPSVVARVQPANIASLRVAAALGLRPERDAIDRSGKPVRILRKLK